jgi:hypothetical protein
MGFGSIPGMWLDVRAAKHGMEIGRLQNNGRMFIKKESGMMYDASTVKRAVQ